MKIKSNPGTAGFTLIEMLVVTVIILLLAGLLFPVLKGAMTRARETKAKADVRQLDMAFRAVLLDYRTWDAAGHIGPATLSANKGVVEFLTGVDTAKNSKGIRYMEFDQKSLDSSQNFIDPWKNAYQIALGDSSVTVDSALLYRQVAAWSWGSKGKAASQYKDYIKSWE